MRFPSPRRAEGRRVPRGGGGRAFVTGQTELGLALDAYDQFGKGRHPARLNLGDCFTYAAAKADDAPLLHKDEGFWLSDVRQARERWADA